MSSVFSVYLQVNNGNRKVLCLNIHLNLGEKKLWEAKLRKIGVYSRCLCNAFPQENHPSPDNWGGGLHPFMHTPFPILFTTPANVHDVDVILTARGGGGDALRCCACAFIHKFRATGFSANTKLALLLRPTPAVCHSSAIKKSNGRFVVVRLLCHGTGGVGLVVGVVSVFGLGVVVGVIAVVVADAGTYVA